MTKGELALLVLAAGGFVLWALDVLVRPYRRHRPCKGTGRVRVRGNRYDFCAGCDGGRKPPQLRAGAGWLRPDLPRRRK